MTQHMDVLWVGVEFPDNYAGPVEDWMKAPENRSVFMGADGLVYVPFFVVKKIVSLPAMLELLFSEKHAATQVVVVDTEIGPFVATDWVASRFPETAEIMNKIDSRTRESVEKYQKAKSGAA